MFIGFIGYWCLGLTSAYTLAFPLGFGPRGIWWGLVTGLAAAAIMLSLRFEYLTSRIQPPSSPEAHHDEDVVDGMGPSGDAEAPQDEEGVQEEPEQEPEDE